LDAREVRKNFFTHRELMKSFILLSIATLTLFGFGGQALAENGGFCNKVPSAVVCPNK
jgi:hypothetical protein